MGRQSNRKRMKRLAKYRRDTVAEQLRLIALFVRLFR